MTVLPFLFNISFHGNHQIHYLKNLLHGFLRLTLTFFDVDYKSIFSQRISSQEIAIFVKIVFSFSISLYNDIVTLKICNYEKINFSNKYTLLLSNAHVHVHFHLRTRTFPFHNYITTTTTTTSNHTDAKFQANQRQIFDTDAAVPPPHRSSILSFIFFPSTCLILLLPRHQTTVPLNTSPSFKIIQFINIHPQINVIPHSTFLFYSFPLFPLFAHSCQSRHLS